MRDTFLTPNGYIRLKPLFSLLGTIIALYGVFYAVTYRRNTNAEVTHTYWYQGQQIERYQTVREDDWSVPTGGRVYNTRQEISGYERVLVGYEEVAYEVEHCTYLEQADGSKEEVCDPPTVEYRKEPVYKSVPVYDTKYYYEIDKWLVDRVEWADGYNSEPYWPATLDNIPERPGTDIIGAKRKGMTKLHYTIRFTDNKRFYETDMTLDNWKNWKRGDRAVLVLGIMNNIIEVRKVDFGW